MQRYEQIQIIAYFVECLMYMCIESIKHIQNHVVLEKDCYYIYEASLCSISIEF